MHHNGQQGQLQSEYGHLLLISVLYPAAVCGSKLAKYSAFMAPVAVICPPLLTVASVHASQRFICRDRSLVSVWCLFSHLSFASCCIFMYNLNTLLPTTCFCPQCFLCFANLVSNGEIKPLHSKLVKFTPGVTGCL